MVVECLNVEGEADVNLVSDDPAAPPAISIQFVCGNDPDCSQGAAGNHVGPEEEEFVETTKFVTVDGKKFRVRTRTFEEGQKTILVKKGQQVYVQNASRDAFGSEGIIIQTPFFPGRIWIGTNGHITVLPSDTCCSGTYPNIPTNVGQPHASRKLVPGTQVAFKAHNGKFVCAEHWGKWALRANRVAVSGWEVFTVVQKNGTDKRFGLRSAANGLYVSYAGGRGLVANCAELSSADYFFLEVDAGDGKVALKTADGSSLYVGKGEVLGLVPEMKEWEKFVVFPIA